jgi:hypothetical protein
VGKIRHLTWVGRFEFAGDGDTVGAHEGEVFTAGGELKIGMQAGSRSASICARGEDHQEPAGRQVGGRKPPFVEVTRIIGEGPSAQV